MPIMIKHGSIFDSTADVLVCPVNCVGVIGKGLALEFKRRFPHESKQYMEFCHDRYMLPGRLFLRSPIWFAATKDHWKNQSEMHWVEESLIWLARFATEDGKSIAIPQLGCGCGGLDWADVWPLYEKHLGDLPATVEVWIYE